MSKSPPLLRKALSAALQANEKTRDLSEDEDTLKQLVQLVAEEATDHLAGFADYLEGENCLLPPKEIAALSESLILTPESRKLLGIKALNLWLQFKIYEVLDILRNLKNSN